LKDQSIITITLYNKIKYWKTCSSFKL